MFVVGVVVSCTQRNTMTDCQISHSKGSGLAVYNGGLMTIDGDATTIHDNCTGGIRQTYGLDTGSTNAKRKKQEENLYTLSLLPLQAMRLFHRKST